jgi:putative nucleotidyltransferase with HDIG domain
MNSSTGKPTILIVEDDAVSRLVLRRMLLSESEWDVMEAENGVTAWKLLEKGQRVDLCIADIKMPELDGVSLLGKIRANEALKHLKVILCTALRDRDTIARVAALAVDYYVVKPFKKDLLLARVRQALPGREATKPSLQTPAPLVKGDLSGFLRRAQNPPSLPSIYQELVEAVGRPDASIREVSEIILQDPGLSLRLLKLANSAFYGSSEVNTVESAAQLIGIGQIQKLVLATSVIKSFDKLPARLVDVRAFWEHSLACGITSALLAEFKRDPTPERFFIGGLLHDIGRLVMYLNAPDQSREILEKCEREHLLACNVERDVLGFDHCELGAELMSNWGLPKSLVEIVKRHHLPPKTSSPAAQDAFIVHYADFIVTALQFGNSGEIDVSPLIPPANSAPNYLDDWPIDPVLSELESRFEALVPIILEQPTNPAPSAPVPTPKGTGSDSPDPSIQPAAVKSEATRDVPYSPEVLQAAEASVNDRFRHVAVTDPILETIKQRAIVRTAARLATPPERK